MLVNIKNVEFHLLPDKALWRPDKRQLIIADIHLGKAAHFRKAGINFPSGGALDDIEKMQGLINKYLPVEVILLGDLFHSTYNSEWILVDELLNFNAEIKFLLVKGNHDLIKFKELSYSNFEVCDKWEDVNFIYSHMPQQIIDKYVICGHIHPGISLTDSISRSFRLPCFYMSNQLLILPAFGKLTGLQIVKKKYEDDCFYVIYNSRISKM